LTLDECFLAVAIGATIIPKTGSASSAPEQENKGDGMATKRDEQAADYRAEAIAGPFADAAERSSTVSKTGEGQSGMRTERITLEVTHGAALSAREWRMWRTIFDPRYGESVRVVEEPHFDDLAQVAMQRDAAIREREVALARVAHLEDGNRALKDAADAACDLLDESNARVAELEAASGGGEGEPVAWGVIDERQKVREQFEERDDAVSYARAAIYGQIVEKQKLTVVPLYRSPPQPRGWLTAEEREAVQWAADAAYDKQHPAEDTLRNILARSSPPEVDLPISLSPIDEELIRAALAAAGVAVKEGGRE
jgi:hypothetical protein